MEPLPIAPYTEEDFFSGRQKDPINLVYAGELATLNVVLRITTDLLECRTDWGVGDQVFGEPLTRVILHKQDLNRATSPASGLGGRYHTRIYQLLTEHAQLGRLIASPIHHERWDQCGWLINDTATSFDLARDWAVERLKTAGYVATFLPLVRFAPVKQCDGRWVSTDGRLAVVAQQGFFESRGISTSSVVAARQPQA